MKCPKCSFNNENNSLECFNCGYKFSSDPELYSKMKKDENIKEIKIYTTDFIPNTNIEDYLGIVSYEVIFGVNFLKEIFTAISDIVGGRSETYEKTFQDAKELAMQKIKQECFELGGNAIIGTKINFSTPSESKMIMVSVYGTAVKLQNCKLI